MRLYPPASAGIRRTSTPSASVVSSPHKSRTFVRPNEDVRVRSDCTLAVEETRPKVGKPLYEFHQGIADGLKGHTLAFLQSCGNRLLEQTHETPHL